MLGAAFGLAIFLPLIPRIIANVYTMMYQIPPLEPASHVGFILLSAGLILAAVLVATMGALKGSLQDNAAALMRPKAPPAGKRILLERIRPLWRRMKFTHKVTARNLFRYKKRFLSADFRIKNTLDAISHATCAMSIDVNAKAIVVCSVSGTTARMVSRFRSPVDIVGMTTDPKVWRKLALSWGVTPMLSEKFNSVDVMFYKAMACAKQALDLQTGDNVVLTAGPINGQSGNTNTIKVEQVQ